ncbi:MAG: T9SS type A sorting domain-containing protein [Bacteroidota bacterium]
MKKLSIVIMLLLVAMSLGAQTFEYTYDAAGNRVKRQIVVMKNLESHDSLSDAANTPVSEQLGEMTINVFPNPVEQRLNVNIANLPAEITGKIGLFDMGGRELMNRTNLSTANTFDISTLPSGLYILRLTAGNDQKEWKIIKE